MKKNPRLKVLLLSLVCVVAVHAKSIKVIERGMTKEQVTSVLGKPATTSFDANSETWRYVKSRGGLLDPYIVNITVGFDAGGIVVSYGETVDDQRPSVSPSQSSGVPPRMPFDGYYGQRSLTASDFGILQSKVKAASFESGKLDLIQVASLGGYFTCSQCASLLSVFSFTDGKMKALRFMAPHIVDTQNASDIYRQFTFSSDKDKAADILRMSRNGR